MFGENVLAKYLSVICEIIAVFSLKGPHGPAGPPGQTGQTGQPVSKDIVVLIINAHAESAFTVFHFMICSNCFTNYFSKTSAVCVCQASKHTAHSGHYSCDFWVLAYLDIFII